MGRQRGPSLGHSAHVAPAETENFVVSGERRFPPRLGLGSALRWELRVDHTRSEMCLCFLSAFEFA